jgi:phosphoribosylglycinamide formyltransferase-1
MKRIVILISGRGSNMQAMLKVAAAEHWPAQIVAVISNQPNAAGLDVARAEGIATSAINHRDYPDREQFDVALAELIDQHSPDLF